MRNNIGTARRAYALSVGRFTQDDAALFFGVSPSTYKKWEQGRVVTNGLQLRQLADKYGVTTDYLLARGSEGVWPPAPREDAISSELLRHFSRLNPAGRARLLEDAAILDESGRYTTA